ncbi:MAG TPA: glycosyltransferase family 4 protein [Chthonomonadaceae bacterium]|nr:glycosyltransferase family 4 protein [Chthonomonadaceae bacterium]
MRILFFSDNFRPEPCPPAAHVYERAKLWASWGHEVTVITTAPNFPEGKVFPGYTNRWRFVENMDGIRVVRVKTFIARNEGFLLRSLDYMSFVLPALCCALLEARPDIVISTSPQLFTPVAGVLYSKLRRVPHVFELRDLWPASILATSSMQPGRLYRLLERLEMALYRHSTRILSITNSFVKDLTARGISADKIDVVLNGTNLDLFSPRPKDEEIETRYGLKDRFVIGYLGTLGLAHGLENVLHTAQLLRDLPVSFLFVGVGAAKEKLQARARELELQNVVFVPRQLKEDMPRFWSVCDASLVHLRNAELFKTVIPSKIFESMAMGLPILFVGPRGEGAEVVERHRAGLIVTPEDPQALAGAIRTLLGNPKLQESLADNALTAAPGYSRKRHAEGTLEVLTRALQAYLGRKRRREPDAALPPLTEAVVDSRLVTLPREQRPWPDAITLIYARDPRPDGTRETLETALSMPDSDKERI